MNKITLIEKHIELLECVNDSKNKAEYEIAYSRLNGFRDALNIIGIHHLIDCDLHYINQGIDRPMCGGVFLDWVES